MRKITFISFTLICSQVYGGEGNDSIYSLSNSAMDIVTRMDQFPRDGHFNLTPKEADLVLAVGQNDVMIGDRLAVEGAQDKVNCDDDKKAPTTLLKAYDSRFRIAAVTLNTFNEFKKSEELKFQHSSLSPYLRSDEFTKNALGSWDSIMASYMDYDKKLDAGENAKKLANFLLKRTGVDVPTGAIAAEFMYRDMLKSPEDWKNILSKSKNALSFDEKISLISKLGEQFGNDYNYGRLSGDASKGLIPITALLTKLSTEESGGVCRDIALAQTQMLKAMGIDHAYSVNFLSNSGGHATVIVADPNDKNRVVKLNYGEIYTDDARKGSSALQQDSTLPNVGLNYRIFDSEGKPVTAIPTELGSILRETTGFNKGLEAGVPNYSLQKVYFGNDYVRGALFTGQTSSGDSIVGASVFGNASTKNFFVETGAAAFKNTADRTYYSIDQTGLYFNGTAGARATVYDGKIGNFKTEIGASVEVMATKVDSKSKANGGVLSKTLMDADLTTYAKLSHEKDISPNDKISTSLTVKGRFEKGNTADEGTKALQYDGMVLMSKYDRKIADGVTASLAIAETFGTYGTSTAVKAALESGKNKVAVSANIRGPGSIPSFFPDQQNSVKASYERATENGWNLMLEFGKNFDSKSYMLNGKAEKKF